MEPGTAASAAAITGHIILKTMILKVEHSTLFEYDNPITGVHYNLDWDKYGVYDKLIETTNKNEKVLPCRTLPYYKLESILYK